MPIARLSQGVQHWLSVVGFSWFFTQHGTAQPDMAQICSHDLPNLDAWALWAYLKKTAKISSAFSHWMKIEKPINSAILLLLLTGIQDQRPMTLSGLRATSIASSPRVAKNARRWDGARRDGSWCATHNWINPKFGFPDSLPMWNMLLGLPSWVSVAVFN